MTEKYTTTSGFVEKVIEKNSYTEGVRPSAVEELVLLLRGWVDHPGQLTAVLRKILELLQIPLAQFGIYLDTIDPTHTAEKYRSVQFAWEQLQLEIVGSAPYASSLRISRVDAIAQKNKELIHQIDNCISSISKVTGKRKISESEDWEPTIVSKLRKLATSIEYGAEDCLLLLHNYLDGTLSTQAVLTILERIDNLKNAQ